MFFIEKPELFLKLQIICQKTTGIIIYEIHIVVISGIFQFLCILR